MILRQLTARVTNHGNDPYGRFTWHKTLLDGTRNLLVVTAYRVSQRRTKGCGPTTSFMQQWRQLRAKGIANPNPQQQMLDDLATFLTPHLQAGNEVIIMMDANDSIDSRPMDEFMDSLDLWDLMADFLPHTPPTTYHRGSKKIDHIIGTQGIYLQLEEHSSYHSVLTAPSLTTQYVALTYRSICYVECQRHRQTTQLTHRHETYGRPTSKQQRSTLNWH